MTLTEALNQCEPNQIIQRKTWIDSGIKMYLSTSAKLIQELGVSLTKESLQAEDWVVRDMPNE